LIIRVAGDFILAQPLSSSSLGYIWNSSLRRWFIVAAMLAFVIMIHKSMKKVDHLEEGAAAK
jgi:hypothetical protein